MGRFVFGLMQSLDGYIAGPSGGPQSGGLLSSQAAAGLPPPGPILFRHFAEHVRSLNGVLYGRRMYEVMRYWEEDKPDWDDIEHDFALAWRSKPKWVASRSLKSVGPNATLVQGDLIDFVRNLKCERKGDVGVAGPELANVLSAAGLIDEYRLYFRPYVLGGGKPYFDDRVPPLRLVKLDAIGEDAVRLIYVPA
jgi:dihydrofolate reductase